WGGRRVLHAPREHQPLPVQQQVVGAPLPQSHLLCQTPCQPVQPFDPRLDVRHAPSPLASPHPRNPPGRPRVRGAGRGLPSPPAPRGLLPARKRPAAKEQEGACVVSETHARPLLPPCASGNHLPPAGARPSCFKTSSISPEPFLAAKSSATALPSF